MHDELVQLLRAAQLSRGRGGPRCWCGGCNGRHHLHLTFRGEQVPTGVVHHMGRHLFEKRNSLRDIHTEWDAHSMCDDELLAHCSAYDDGCFAQAGKIPKPRVVPLLEVPAGDEPARLRAVALINRGDLGSDESVIPLPHLAARKGELCRYGDVLLVAGLAGGDGGAGDALEPATLLVKAALPAVGMSVAIVLELIGKGSRPAAPRAESALGALAPLETILVPDAAILALARGANWESIREHSRYWTDTAVKERAAGCAA